MSHSASGRPSSSTSSTLRIRPAFVRSVRSQPVAAGEAARAVPARAHNSAIRRLSTRPRTGAPDFRQRTCDEQRSWGTQPANMSMTNPREPRERPGRPANRNHITPSTNHTRAHNPCPLTATPPYGRRRRSGPLGDGGGSRAAGRFFVRRWCRGRVGDGVRPVRGRRSTPLAGRRLDRGSASAAGGRVMWVPWPVAGWIATGRVSRVLVVRAYDERRAGGWL